MAAESSGQQLSDYVRTVLKKAAEYDVKELSLIQYPEKGKERKDTNLNIRMPEALKQEIQTKAKQAGVSASSYVIHALTGKDIIVVIDGKSILHQLSKMGTNLNQLTIMAHQGRITCPDLEQVKLTHTRILKELIHIVKGIG